MRGLGGGLTMKKHIGFGALTGGAILLLLPTGPVCAQDATVGGSTFRSFPSPAYVKFDTNKTGYLEIDEIDNIKRAFEEDPKNPLLKDYDGDKDRKLSNDEIGTIMPKIVVEGAADRSPGKLQGSGGQLKGALSGIDSMAGKRQAVTVTIPRPTNYNKNNQKNKKKK